MQPLNDSERKTLGRIERRILSNAATFHEVETAIRLRRRDNATAQHEPANPAQAGGLTIDRLDNDQRTALRRAVYNLADACSALRAVANDLERADLIEEHLELCALFEHAEKAPHLNSLLRQL